MRLIASRIHSFIHPRQYFWRMLLSFMVLMAAVLVLLIGSFSVVYTREVQEKLMDQYAAELANLQGELDRQIDSLTAQHAQLLLQSDVSRFLHSRDAGARLYAYSSLRHLQSLRTANPYLGAIQIYTEDQPYTVCNGSPSLDFPAFLEGRLEQPQLTAGTPAVLLRDERQASLAFVFPEFYRDTDRCQYAVAFVLDTQFVEQSLRTGGDATAYVLDQAGTVLYCSAPRQQGRSLADWLCYDRIRAGERGSFRSEDGASIVTYAHSPGTGLLYVTVNDIGTFAAAMGGRTRLLALIALAALPLCTLLGLLLANRLYRPVRETRTYFARQSAMEEQVQRMSEIDALRFAYNRELAVNRESAQLLQRNAAVLHNERLRRLLTQPLTPTLAGEIAAERWLVAPEQGRLALLLAGEGAEDPERDLKLSALARQWFAQRGVPLECTGLGAGELALLFPPQPEAPALLTDLLAAAQEAAPGCTAALGPPAGGLERCAQACAGLRSLLDYRFLHGAGRVYTAAVRDRARPIDFGLQARLEDALGGAILARDRERFVTTVDAFLEAAQTYSCADAMAMAVQVSALCVNAMNRTINEDGRKLGNDELVRIGGNAYLHVIRERLLALYDRYQRILAEIYSTRSAHHLRVVKDALNYIDQHYADPDLGVEALAQRANYTAYYFSKLFKESAGSNVSDHIRQVRIGHAKELLARSSLRIRDIPERVGFTSQSYFTRVFRESVGLTPGAYRERKRRETP